MLFPCSASLGLVLLSSLLTRGPDDEPNRLAAPLPPDVLAVLAPAIEAQHGREFESNLRDFEVRLTVETRDPKKGTLNFDLERVWARPEVGGPDRMWTRVEETATKKTYEEGFDGSIGWLSDSKGVIVYDGIEYRADRAKLQDDVELMHLLMQFFFLRNALPELRDAKRLPAAAIEVPSESDPSAHVKVECERVEARMTLADVVGGESTVTLSIAKDDHLLRAVSITPIDTKNAPSEIRFDDHRKNGQGVIVPINVSLFRNGEKTASQRFWLWGEDSKDGKDVVNNIRFNTGVALERFAAPKGQGKRDPGDK